MKLGDLISQDASGFNPDEWTCQLHLGPLKGAVSCDLASHDSLPNGNVHLVFEYRATKDFTFIGYSLLRIWRQDDGTVTVRNLRGDVWTPAYVALAGSVTTVDLIIEPREWA